MVGTTLNHYRITEPLVKASEDRSFDLISIKVDPRFGPLKEDRRFASIAKQLGVV